MKLLTQKEAAKILRCSTHYLGALRKTGKIDGIKFGNRWLYREQDIEKFVAFNFGKINDEPDD